jgi:hypothetical protein
MVQLVQLVQPAAVRPGKTQGHDFPTSGVLEIYQYLLPNVMRGQGIHGNKEQVAAESGSYVTEDLTRHRDEFEQEGRKAS